MLNLSSSLVDPQRLFAEFGTETHPYYLRATFAWRIMKAEPKLPAPGEDAANGCTSFIRLGYESVDELVSVHFQSDGI